MIVLIFSWKIEGYVLNQKECLGIIALDMPDLVSGMTRVKTLHNRHSFVLEFSAYDENYIFKFPLNANDYNIFREAEVLKFLDGRLSSVRIPQIFCIGRKYPYIAYKKIEKPLLTIQRIREEGAEKREDIFLKLTQFLSEVHGLSEDICDAIDIPRNPAERYPENILSLSARDYVCKDIRQFAERTVGEFSKWSLECKRPERFLYNDLHFGNLLMGDDGDIAVLDFGFCAVGDVHREFHQMHKCYEEWLKFFSRAYESITGVCIDLKGVELTSKIDQLNYYLHLLDLQDQQVGKMFDYLPDVKAPIVRWIEECR